MKRHHIVATRSRFFTEYLNRLPTEERKRIEALERGYLDKGDAPRQRATYRDFTEGRVNIRDDIGKA